MTISDSIATQRALPAISSATLNSSAASISSFATQLTSAIEQMLGESKTGSQIEIDIDAAPAQSAGNRQITMVLKNLPPSDTTPGDRMPPFLKPPGPSQPALAPQSAAPKEAGPGTAVVPIYGDFGPAQPAIPTTDSIPVAPPG